MYIGSTDLRGLHHLLFEIVDNAVDEALAGCGSSIKVTIHKDESISVEASGRGMTRGMHSTGKMTPEAILTGLHGAGKYGQECDKGRCRVNRRSTPVDKDRA